MKRIMTSSFKASCLAAIKNVQTTGEPVLITTKWGSPVVKIVPAVAEMGNIFGFMADDFKIVGDIESPVVPVKGMR